MMTATEPALHDRTGIVLDEKHGIIRVDLTKPQTIQVFAHDSHGNVKPYFLKVTTRGLVLV